MWIGVSIGEISDNSSNNQYEESTSYASFPTLLRTDTWEEFMLAEERTAEISTCVICPKEDEYTLWKKEIKGYLSHLTLLER